MEQQTPVQSDPPAKAESKNVDQRSVKDPDEFFGLHIESIAAYHRINPGDVALSIASVVANISGPYAGFVDPFGRKYHPHLNLVRIDGDSPNANNLEAALFEPLQKRLRWLRHAATCQSKLLSDRHTFGDHSVDQYQPLQNSLHPWIKDNDHRLAQEQQEMLSLNYLPRQEFNEMALVKSHYLGSRRVPVRASPGISYLPTLMAEGVSVDQIGGALNEALHRQLFVFNPSGGIFNLASKKAVSDENTAANLCSVLQGRDLSFAPHHRDQGRGTLEFAKIQMVAKSTLLRIGGILQNPGSNWNEVIKTCLLWEGAPWKPPTIPVNALMAAWQSYEQVIQELIELRCFNPNHAQKRLSLPQDCNQSYIKLRMEYSKALQAVKGVDGNFTAQFFDLPERLLWVFMQFHQEHEPFWCVQTAFYSAVYAIRKQQQLLHKARTTLAKENATKSMAAVTAILRDKGPCNVRQMQRSTKNRAASFFKTGISILEKEGRVKKHADDRYELLQAETESGSVRESQYAAHN